MKSSFFLFTALLFNLISLSNFAQWSSDPLVNSGICVMDQTQRETEICTDNQGNTYIFWRDYRNEPSTFGGDIYAQKLNQNGEVEWLAGGISIVTKSAAQFDVKALYDGVDGIYLVWRETVNLFSDYKIYAQRILLNGTKLWGTNGILLQSISGKAVFHSIFVNEDGDLLISWQLDLATPNAVDLYAQKINRDGVVQWNSNGLIICSETARHVYGAQIISDQNGGAIVSWSDNRIDLSNYDIYAQRVSSNGNILWTQNGISVSNNFENQYTKHAIMDTNGGAMIFWEEFQQLGYVISVTRIDSSGNHLLSSGGKVLYFSNDPLTQYEFIKSKQDKIYFLYTNSNHNTFTQILDYDGNYLSGGEIPICTTQSSTSNLALYNADANGLVLAWQDNRNGNFDIYAQWINSDGLAMWTANGVPVCIEVSEQTDYDICSCSISGAVVSWADMRNGSFDIYAQNIDVRGKLGSSRYIFQKNGLNKAISNPTITSDSLIVALPPTEQAGYSSVTVLLDSVIHPDVTELIITLKHIGIIDTIIYELPGGEDLISCFLDDYALQNISSSAPPFSGIYKPYKPLTAFIGADLNGEWIIEIEDNFQWDDGTLKAWGLIFNKDNATDINVETGLDQVNSFILYQNYPNPFNPSTKISWQAPVSGWLTIKLFDLLGQEIETIVDGYYEAGNHSTLYIVNSTSPSGVYFYQLKAGEFIQTKKMILLK